MARGEAVFVPLAARSCWPMESSESPDPAVLSLALCDSDCPEQAWMWLPVGNIGGEAGICEWARRHPAHAVGSYCRSRR
jgi:hypothetical protein